MKILCLQEEMRQIGVYAIVCRISEKSYIGSTKQSFRKRLNSHIYLLRQGAHPSSLLQTDWNNLGEEGFEFRILEAIPEEEITDGKYVKTIEQIYLDSAANTYNVCPVTTDCSGRPCSDETKQKMSTVRKGVIPSEANRLAVIEANSKSYTFRDPQGVERSFFNLRAFCREKELSQTHMVRVAKGKQAHHKNWTCLSAMQ